MKHLTLAALLLSAIALVAFADDKPKAVAGPKGGKMLDNEKPRAEFFVDKDRNVVITFYGDDMKPVAATEQSAVVWADAPKGRVKLTLENKDGVLVSTKALPEGDRYRVVVQLKSEPNAKAQSLKVKFDLSICDGCKCAEYACVCDEEHDHDHDHKDSSKDKH